MTKKCIVVMGISTIFLFSAISCVYAAKNSGEKLARGTMNFWNAQYAVWDKTHESIYYNGLFRGVGPGFAEGVAAFTVRSFGAIYDILTFWLPVPKDYKPVVEPELNF